MEDSSEDSDFESSNAANRGNKANPTATTIALNDDDDDDFVATKKIFNSPPKLPSNRSGAKRRRQNGAADQRQSSKKARTGIGREVVSSASSSRQLANPAPPTIQATNIPPHNRPPTPEYGSEWDSDGEATLAAERRQMKKKANSNSTKEKVEQKPTVNSSGINSATLNAAIRNAMPTASTSQSSSRDPTETSRTNDRKRKSDETAAKSAKSAKSKRTAAPAQSNETLKYQATTETSEANVSFINHELKKQITHYICPFINNEGKI